jgi:DNA mismatch endonuclease (patch repair protein)
MADHLSREQRSRNMAAVRSKNTTPEMLARKAAHRLGLRFRLHRTDLPGSPDIVFPKHRMVAFVHGCFWHGHGCSRSKLPQTNIRFWREKIEKNKLRDRKAEANLRLGGWQVLVLWQCQIRNLDMALARMSAVSRKLGNKGHKPNASRRAGKARGRLR